MYFVQDRIKIIKILCNPKRFAIVSLLSKTKGGLCVNQIADNMKMSQSLTSHQLSFLETSGVVIKTRMGQSVCYTLSSTPIVKKLLKVTLLLS